MALTSKYNDNQLLAAAQQLIKQSPAYATGWTAQQLVNQAKSGDSGMMKSLNTLAVNIPTTVAAPTTTTKIDPLTTFYNNLSKATTSAQINALVAQAKNDKIGYDTARVTNALATTPEAIAAANAAANAKAAADKATTNASIAAKAAAAQAATDKSMADKIAAAKAATAQAATDKATAQAAADKAMADKVAAAKVAADQIATDKAAAQAAADKAMADKVAAAKTAADQAAADKAALDTKQAADRAQIDADRQAAINQQNADFAKTLGAPTLGSNGQTQQVYHNGQTYAAVADDPVTGTKGGWYQVSGSGMQKIGTDGMPTGPVIPSADFTKIALTSQSDTASYNQQQQQQAATAKMTGDVTKFESSLAKLPTAQQYYQAAAHYDPATGQITSGPKAYSGTGNLTIGPDGSIYVPVPANIQTGAAGYWLKSTTPETPGQGYNQLQYKPVNAPADAKPISYAEYGQTIKPIVETTATIQNQLSNQAYQQQEAANFAAMAARGNPGQDHFMDNVYGFIDKTIGVKTLLTIIGGMVGGPLGAAGAAALATQAQGGNFGDILKAGLTSYAMAYGADALSSAVSDAVTSGVQQGVIDANIGDQVSQGVTDIANGDPATVVDPTTGTTTTVDPSVNTTTVTDPSGATTVTDPGAGTVTTTDPTGIVTTEPIPVEPVAPTGGTGEPTGPVQPGEAYTPVSEGPQVPNGPQAPTNITSTGNADYAPGTTFTGPDGQTELVLDGGKTVNLAEYQAAQASGNPISIDGQMTTGSNVQVTQAPEISGTEGPVVPGGTTSGPTSTDIPQGYQEVPNPIADLPPGSAESQGFTYNENTGEWMNPETGVGYDPTSGKWIAPLAGATPGQIAAVVTLGAGAAIALASAGGGAAAAPAVATPTPVTTPPTPVAPTPVAPTPVTTPPVTPGPVAPPGTPGTTPVTPGPVTPPGTTPGTPGTTPGTPGTTPGPIDTTTGPINPTPQPPPGTPPSSQVPTPGQPTTPPTVTPPGAENPVKITDYSKPYTGDYSNESVLSRFMSGTISYGDIAALVAAGMVLPSILGLITPTSQPTEQPYGAIPPTQWGKVAGVIGGGVNPGYIIQPAQAPAYATTNPYQAQYNWGQHPYIKTMDQLPTYAPPPTPGTHGFGLQAGPSQYNTGQLLNQINQTALDPNFVGYSQYPLQGYVAPQPAAQPTGPVMPTPPVALTGFVR